MKQSRFFLVLLAATIVSCGADEPATTDQATTSAAGASGAETRSEADLSGAQPAKDSEPSTESIHLAQADPQEGTADDTQADEQAATPEPAIRTEWKFAEGRHYQRLNSAQGTSGPPDTIEVAEVFWYGCDACRRFDPVVESWAASLPADVNFIRIPVIWDNPAYTFHARLFYTAEALGVLERTHVDTFTAILERRSIASEEDAQEFFEGYGVSEEDFRKHFRSFTTNSNLGKAAQLVSRYRVTSTPTMVVNGKYVANGPEVRSWGMVLDIVDELVARERQRL